MWTKIKWTIGTLLALFVAATFYYSLPSHDVVRIVGTDVKRVDLGLNSFFWAGDDPNMDNPGNRDVRFVEAVWPNTERSRVYRNEDTHWGWPPYFKFDSGDVSATAKNLTSNQSDPIWVDVMHYGVRVDWLSIYPNVISIKQVDGPDVIIIPWFNILFLTGLAVFALWLWRKIRRWKANRVDPVLTGVSESVSGAVSEASDRISSVGDDLSDTMRDASYKATGLRDRFSRWLDTWRPKSKRQNR